MNEPRLKHVSCLDSRGLHRMAYWEWGDAANPRVLVCVHGLARQGRDFDTLARAMAGDYRVVCPDIVGRGCSERLVEPMAYGFATYVADMITLLARMGTEQVDWVGTSMGGVIGMMLASLRDRGGRSLINRLVLNDTGPRYEQKFVDRLKSYLGQPVHWRSLDEAADALWVISQGFGPHTREQWLALTRPMLVPHTSELGDGFTLHYDPAIAMPIRAMTAEMGAAGEALLWQAYDHIVAPTLLLRGETSDLLLAETAQAMLTRGPRPRLHQFAGVGHAPTLQQPDQVAVVRDFLLGHIAA
jgi:pimeloyl-ACP methyl ester carboxylesterase